MCPACADHYPVLIACLKQQQIEQAQNTYLEEWAYLVVVTEIISQIVTEILKSLD